MKSNTVEQDSKWGYSIAEFSELTGLSKDYLYHLSASGELPVQKCGSRVIILAERGRAWLESKSRGGEK